MWTRSVKENQHLFHPPSALSIMLHLSAHYLITTRAEHRGKSPSSSFNTSTHCCTPEESREREGLLYGIVVKGKWPLSFPQPISSVFQTPSGPLTEFSDAHRVNPSLSQWSPPHNVKSFWKEPKGSLFWVRLCGGGTLRKLDL